MSERPPENDAAAEAEGDEEPTDKEPGPSRERYKRITGIGTSAAQAALVPALAMLTALIIGAVIIAIIWHTIAICIRLTVAIARAKTYV